MKRNKFDIVEKHQSLNRPLILDGAIGSMLLQNDIPPGSYLWTSIANITHPADVINLHKEYIETGADIITTNTFRTNPNALKHSTVNVSQEDLVKAGVNCALEATDGEQIIIAGSNAPAEDCYQKERTISKRELEYNHKKHIELLWNYGCDIILNETQSHFDEIEVICGFCSANNLPFMLSLYFTESLKLLDGESLITAVELIESCSPIAIGFNCIKTGTFIKFTESNKLPIKWGAYFNCGAGNVTDEQISCGVNPEDYAESVEPLIKLNPFFLGSCCGSSPYHTRALKEKINEVYRN